MSEQNFNLRDYFLGKLSEAEAEVIDLKILADGDIEPQLLFAEDELIEDFLDDNLNAEEAVLFKSNFLISDERKKRFSEIKLLRRFAKAETFPEKSDEKNGATDSFLGRVSISLDNLYRPLIPAFGVIVLVLIGIIAWQSGLFIGGPEFSQLDKDMLALNDRSFRELNEFQSFSKLSLNYGLSRSSDSAGKIDAETLDGNIFVRLVLPADVAPNEAFSVKISRNENDTISLKETRAYQNTNGADIRFLFPKTFAVKGVYRISVERVSDPTYILNYAFRID